MKIQFIGQGISQGVSVGQRLLESLSNDAYNGFVVISAFASVKAVNGIKEVLGKSAIEDIEIIVGIDQKGTSKEA